MNPFYAEVARRAGHRCEYCHAPEAVFNFPFEVDHIEPVIRGGSDDMENLALACRACNLRKAAHVVAVDPETQQECPLFNPRTDFWAAHLQPDPINGRMVGRTPLGRAAVLLLAMNSEIQTRPANSGFDWTCFRNGSTGDTSRNRDQHVKPPDSRSNRSASQGRCRVCQASSLRMSNSQSRCHR